MEEILSLKQYPERTICIAIGHDEEVGGFDGASSISNVLKKRDMKFDFILDEGTMMISGVIPGTKGAIGLIGTVEKGNITVELSVTGSGGHSSAPPINSESIMQVISKAVIAVESNPLPAHFERGSAFRSTMEHLAPKVTFPWNLIYSNFWIFGPLFKQLLKRASNGAAACIRTTTAVTKMSGGTKINVLPFEAKAYINHRVHPGDSFESVLNHDR
jgi:carboxypeptidase PM20D1